jgi:uncharacterized membrane protein YwzB
MNSPLKHNLIKQTIAVAIIWVAFQATNLSSFISQMFGISQVKDFVTVSVFIALYKLSNYLYDEYLWKVFYKKFVLSGSWVYALCGISSKNVTG